MNDCINFHPETFRDSFGSPKKIKKRTNRKRSSSFFEYMNNTSSDRSSNSQYSSETFRDSFISKSRSCSDLSSHESSPLNDDLKDANPFFSVPSVVDSSSSPTMMNWLCNQKIDNSSSSKSSSSGTSVDIDTSKIKHSNNFDLREVFLVFLLHQSCMNHQNFVTICHKLKQEGILPSMNIPEDLPKLQSIYKSFYPQIKTWLSEAQSEHASVLRKSGSESSLFDSLSNYSSHCKKQCKEIIPAPTPPVIAPTFFDMLLLNHASRLRLDFKLMRKLGHGGFGSVFHVSHRIDGREYAVKTVKFSFKNSYQLRKAYTKVVREVKSLANLDHPNVVRYHQTWFEPCNQFFEDLKDSNSEYSCSLDSEEDDEKIKYSTTRSNSNLGSYHYNNTSQEDNNNYNYNSNNSNEFYNKQMNIQYFDEPFQFPFDDIQEPQNVNLFDLENVSTNTSYSKYDSNYNLTSQCITNPSTVEFPESPPKCTADIPKVSANKLSKQSHNYINTKTTTNTSTNTNTTCSSSSSSSPRNKSSTSAHIYKLPDELLAYIAKFCFLEDVNHCCAVSWRWYQCLASDIVWEQLFFRETNQIDDPKIAKKDDLEPIINRYYSEIKKRIKFKNSMLKHNRIRPAMFIYFTRGLQTAQDIGASLYLESSSKTRENFDECWNAILELMVRNN
eukprot:gb/GECH01013596.1/.p1 GENE.gb/GECH01013596.1/~~gb/GECH01013596.1/.p1  ORF type:complete len:669 (+),score=157.62 gb/GECH01013596.1/:1-2007(+)